MMKLILLVSFVSLSAALPYKRYMQAGEGFSSIVQGFNTLHRALDDMYMELQSLSQRIGTLENQIGIGSGFPDAHPTRSEPVRSDETAVRKLMQSLEARLQEKKLEQKQLK